MKKIVLGIFSLCVLAFATTTQAQNIKLAHINSQELLSVMPEMTKGENDLKAFAKVYQDQLESMGKEFDKKIQDYRAAEKTMSEPAKEVKQKELADLENRIQSTQASAEEKIAKKREEIYKPILEKANTAIKAVAVEKGYTYIFDAAGGLLLHANDSENILPLVKTKLGIK